MTIIQIIVVLVLLALAWFVWQRLVSPNIPAPLAFLRWLVPLLVGVVLIIWLLSMVFGGNILNTKILMLPYTLPLLV